MPRVMKIKTPLEDDVLLFHGMQASEEMSRLCEYELDLLSAQGDVDLDDMLGKNVTVELELPDEATATSTATSRSSPRSAARALSPVHGDVRPWLWFLTRTADCRIFQEMTVPTSSRRCSPSHGVGDFDLELTGSYRKCDVLRAVPRDRLQLRQPADGAGGHLLLLRAHRRPSTRWCCADSTSAHDRRSGLRGDPVRRAGPAASGRARARQQLGRSRASSPAGRVRPRRLRLREAERRARGRARRSARQHAAATSRSSTTPASTCRARRRAATPACASRSCRHAVRGRAGAARTAPRPRGRHAVQARGPPARRPEPRVPGHRGELRPAVRRVRRRRRGAPRATRLLAASFTCHVERRCRSGRRG